jgi:hypothetical protein
MKCRRKVSLTVAVGFALTALSAYWSVVLLPRVLQPDLLVNIRPPARSPFVQTPFLGNYTAAPATWGDPAFPAWAHLLIWMADADRWPVHSSPSAAWVLVPRGSDPFGEAWTWRSARARAPPGTVTLAYHTSHHRLDQWIGRLRSLHACWAEGPIVLVIFSEREPELPGWAASLLAHVEWVRPWEPRVPYPFNAMRNRAIRVSPTDLVLLLDIDFVPTSEALVHIKAAAQSGTVDWSRQVLVLPPFHMWADPSTSGCLSTGDVLEAISVCAQSGRSVVSSCGVLYPCPNDPFVNATLFFLTSL